MTLLVETGAGARSTPQPSRAIVTLDRVPRAQDIRALERVGLRVARMRRLPLAVVTGPAASLARARAAGFAVHPDERLTRLSADSAAAVGAAAVHAAGHTGKGVGIAVVDSGIDATQPALARRVVRNVRVAATEEGLPSLVTPSHPDTDAEGHGTAVAGVAAADGTGDAELLGVAPGADLIGYASSLRTSDVIAALDDVLATADEYRIRVVNISSQRSPRAFDPEDPFHLATRRLAAAGISVVVGAGNRGNEMTLNDMAMAPWVIAAGGTNLAATRWPESSAGLAYDNSRGEALGADGHVHYDGDGLGISHPDVVAPAYAVLSTSTPPATLPPGGGPQDAMVTRWRWRISGTSLAAPHVAGAIAVLLEARPQLTPADVRQVLQVTAQRLRDGSPFGQAGYGALDLARAVKLVTSSRFSAAALARRQRRVDRRRLAERPFRVVSSDHWSFPNDGSSGPPPYVFGIDVSVKTDAVRASLVSSRSGAINAYEWTLTLRDPEGDAVAIATTGQALDGAITTAVQAAAGTPGRWTLEVAGGGDLGAPEPTPDPVVVAAVQLAAQDRREPEPRVFTPTGELDLRLSGGLGTLISPEGCAFDPLAARGELTQATAPPGCRSGGFIRDVTTLDPARVEFVSEELSQPVVIGAPVELRLTLVNEGGSPGPFAGDSEVEIDAIDAGGRFITGIVGEDVAILPAAAPELAEYELAPPPVRLPAGARLRLRMRLKSVQRVDDAASRLLWGGAYGQSGLAVTLGTLE